MFFKFLVVLIAVSALAALGLRIAIAHNGPAVLDTVDRIAGPNVNVERSPVIRFGDDPAQKLIVHSPASRGAASLPVLIFIHGGSWASGDPEDYGFVGRSLAPEGFVTVTAGYRLGPEGRFPGMVEDAAASLRWVIDNIANHGGDPERIVLAGHSAGAYNAAMIALDPRWAEAQAASTTAIRGVVGLAGPYDFYPFDGPRTRAAFGHSDEPETTQPINFAGDHAPPFLLIHGEKDTTVKPRNSQVLAAQLNEAGVQAQLIEIADFDHQAPLLHIASPWRRNPQVRTAMLDFARSVTASVSVQAETR